MRPRVGARPRAGRPLPAPRGGRRASIRTPRPRPTTPPGSGRRPSPPTRRGRRRGDRPRLRPALLADRGPARQPAPQPRPGARARQAGDPPLPERRRAARRPGRAARRAAGGRLRRRRRPAAAFGDRPPGDPPLGLRSVGLRGCRRWSSAAPCLGLRPLLPEGRGGDRGRASASCPADRLLVETDAPYLSAPGAPRRRNEPAWVRITAAWVAEQRGERPRRRSGRSSWRTSTGSSRRPPGSDLPALRLPGQPCDIGG